MIKINPNVNSSITLAKVKNIVLRNVLKKMNYLNLDI